MPEHRAAAERYRTDAAGITTWHSFSYGAHYDPANIRFGPVLAVNEESMAPGAGYDTHRHDDVQIITWVLAGALAHEDSAGGSGTVHAGELRQVVAGAGFTHAERNASDVEPLRFVQTMVVPDSAVSAEIVGEARQVAGPALLHTAGGDEVRISAGEEYGWFGDEAVLVLRWS